MSSKTILSIIGARPQFIKASPIEIAFSAYPGINFHSVHTGQHYDENMSKVFFDQLKLRQPYRNLNAGGKSHAQQTAEMLVGLEGIFLDLKPDLVIVYGDTNSTVSASLAAAKLNIPIAHIEAGLRSFNRTMPEEINRIMTDHLSTILFVPSEAARQHLESEGIRKHVVMTGDVMKDIIMLSLEKGLIPEHHLSGYYYATIHRPYNTDDKDRMSMLLDILDNLPKKTIFSLHPRTRKLLEGYGMKLNYKNIEFIEPQGYLENLAFLKNCDSMITDSGGMQKEAYWMKKKCITVRPETEWKETLDNHCNKLVFHRLEDIAREIEVQPTGFDTTLYGDGHASRAIAKHVMEFLEG